MSEAFRARAEHCDLSVVLQLVSAQWLTGRLVVESELAVEGTIECFEGLPVGASCGSLEGLLAFYETFLVPQVQLAFYVQEVSEPGQGPLGEVMVLLLEACRRLDEWRSLGPQHLRATSPTPQDEAEAALWHALDGSRTLAQVVEHQGMPCSKVVDVVRGWLDEGRALALDAPDTEPPPRESARPDTVAVLARGRAQVRSGDIRDAIASFQEAMALDPHHLLAQQHLLRLRQLHPHLFDPGDSQ
ncbi:MAG: DUF4388 domain-containing protein [Myxococcota bacterium]